MAAVRLRTPISLEHGQVLVYLHTSDRHLPDWVVNNGGFTATETNITQILAEIVNKAMGKAGLSHL